MKIKTDARVTPFIGYCPHCPLHEGPSTHQRLTDVTREMRQCPRCRRVYVVGEAAVVSEQGRCLWCGGNHDQRDCLSDPAHSGTPTDYYLRAFRERAGE